MLHELALGPVAMANLKIIAPSALPGGGGGKFKMVNVVTQAGAGMKAHIQVSDGTHSQVYIASPRYVAGLKTVYISNYVAP